jgi:hypothetical protein
MGHGERGAFQYVINFYVASSIFSPFFGAVLAEPFRGNLFDHRD